MALLKSLITLFIFFGITLSAQTHVVTTSDDYVTGSLRHWVTNSGVNDTIVFDPAILANGSDTIKVDFPIIFNHGLTIKGLFMGGDTLYLSGQDSSRIFYMDFEGVSGVEMYLEDLAIIEGNQYVPDYTQYKDNGGAIMAYGLELLKVSNSVFRGNTTKKEGNGGAIFAIECGLVQLESCHAENNKTTDDSPYLGRGGFLKANSCNVIVSNSSFIGNKSSGIGGAISTHRSTCSISYSRFSNNESYNGGAVGINVPNYLGDTIGIYSNNSFFNNRAVFGGALSISNFHQVYSPPVQYDSIKVVVEGCLFQNNNASLIAGALRPRGVDIEITKSTFVSNSADDYAGAIEFWECSGAVINSTFQNNFAEDANDITFIDEDTRIVNSTFLAGDSTTSDPLISSGAFPDGTIEISGSIVVHKGSNPINGNSILWTNSGYNIFSDNPTFSVGTDQVNINITTLDLEHLGNYGGTTPTMIPSATSPALNAGDPIDFSDAQNSPIYGVRDIGAAERQTISADTALVCGPITWWGNTYSQAGTYTDSAYNAMGTLDSTGVLVLTEINDSATIKNPYIVALEQSVGTTYQWIDCNNPLVTLTGATDSIYQPTTNGSYAVIISLDGCVDTSNCVVYNQVSLDENVLPEQWMTFYPNPTTGSITVRGLDKNSLPTSLVIMDLSGRPLHEMTINSERIQLPPLAEGMYLLKFRGDDGLVQVERVVVRE